jgi:hypothetical protein
VTYWFAYKARKKLHNKWGLDSLISGLAKHKETAVKYLRVSGWARMMY